MSTQKFLTAERFFEVWKKFPDHRFEVELVNGFTKIRGYLIDVQVVEGSAAHWNWFIICEERPTDQARIDSKKLHLLRFSDIESIRRLEGYVSRVPRVY